VRGIKDARNRHSVNTFGRSPGSFPPTSASISANPWDARLSRQMNKHRHLRYRWRLYKLLINRPSAEFDVVFHLLPLCLDAQAHHKLASNKGISCLLIIDSARESAFTSDRNFDY
jgi:hypothetical protein